MKKLEEKNWKIIQILLYQKFQYSTFILKSPCRASKLQNKPAALRREERPALPHQT
jgi:hypothetical protein